jgi:biopolymer transport protein ExbB
MHKVLMKVFSILQSQDRHSPFSALALGGQAAVEHHSDSKHDLHGQISLTEWLTESLRADIDDNAERMQAGLPILASVGSTAPFVGLFGTVWGIYHALVGIGASGQASIDKVAGPVGEASNYDGFWFGGGDSCGIGLQHLNAFQQNDHQKNAAFCASITCVFFDGTCHQT